MRNLKLLNASGYPNRNSPYQIWFSDLLKERHSINGSTSYPKFSDWAADCCFFMTMTFPQHLIRKLEVAGGFSNSSFDIEWDNFHRLYLYVCRHLYGSHFSRGVAASRLPCVIAAVDFEGSRYAASGTLPRKNPHIHAVWVLNPGVVDRFRDLITSARFTLKFVNSLTADRVRFDPYRAQKGSAASAATYAAKSHSKSVSAALGANLLRIYPHSNLNPNGITYRASRKYALRNAHLEKLRRAVRKRGEFNKPWEVTM